MADHSALQPDGTTEERLTRIEVEQIFSREKMSSIQSSLAAFLQEQKDRDEQRNTTRLSERFSRKDIIGYVFSAVGSSGAVAAFIFWLINTQIAPVSSQLTAAVDNQVKALALQAAQFSDRFNSQADSLRAIRLETSNMQIAIGDARVNVTKLEGRTQDDRDRMLIMEKKFEDDRKRELDAAIAVARSSSK